MSRDLNWNQCFLYVGRDFHSLQQRGEQERGYEGLEGEQKKFVYYPDFHREPVKFLQDRSDVLVGGVLLIMSAAQS